MVFKQSRCFCNILHLFIVLNIIPIVLYRYYLLFYLPQDETAFICWMYSTCFNSHSAFHTGSRPWCGASCLAGRSAAMQSGSFLVVCPTTWNGLLIDLRNLLNGIPVLNSTTFSRLFFSAWPGPGAHLSRELEGALYKF